MTLAPEPVLFDAEPKAQRVVLRDYQERALPLICRSFMGSLGGKWGSMGSLY